MTFSDTPIAVTGATGFIGRRLCERLVANGIAVRALTRTPQPSAPGLEWVAGGLGDRTALERLVDGAAAVVHCAGAVRGATAHAFHGPNVEGVATLLAAVAAAGPVQRLLHLSSLAARQPGLSHYAASKLAGERLVLESRVRAAVLRPPAVYGPGDRELLPLLTGLYHGWGVIPGHQGRFSLIYVDDLVGAIRAWLASPEADGDRYEVHDGAANGYAWADVIDALAALRGGSVTALPIPMALLGAVAAASTATQRLMGRAPMLTPGKVRELYYPDWVCSNAAFSARTGWSPQIDLAAGLRQTLIGGSSLHVAA